MSELRDDLQAHLDALAAATRQQRADAAQQQATTATDRGAAMQALFDQARNHNEN